MKTSPKYFFLAVGPRSGTSSQKWPKTHLTYDVTKNETQNPKFFFHSSLEDLWSLNAKKQMKALGLLQSSAIVNTYRAGLRYICTLILA